MDNPFLKYIMKDEKEDIFHSSAYGKSQSGENFGTTSSESFTARRTTDQNRQFVKGYGDSRISNTSVNMQHAKTYTPPAKNLPQNPRAPH